MTRARRRVEPVHLRAADGAAARDRGRRARADGRHRGRADLEALRRDHDPPDGAASASTVEQDGWRSFRVPAGARYASPGSIHVEGDASSASYFLAAGAIGGGPVRVTGVGRRSIQGDVAFADALARMGAVIDGGDDWIEARAGRALDGIDDRLHGDSRCGDDARGRRAVRARADHADRHRELAREGDRSHRGDGGRAAQARRDRRRGRRSPHRASAANGSRRRPSPPTTIIGWRCASRSRRWAASPVRIVDPDCVRKTFPGYFAAFAQVAACAS